MWKMALHVSRNQYHTLLTHRPVLYQYIGIFRKAKFNMFLCSYRKMIFTVLMCMIHRAKLNNAKKLIGIIPSYLFRKLTKPATCLSIVFLLDFESID